MIKISKKLVGKQIAVKWEDHWDTREEKTQKQAAKELQPYVGIASGTLVTLNGKMIALASNVWVGEDSYDGTIFNVMRKNITNVGVVAWDDE